jgi:hypothetical protein
MGDDAIHFCDDDDGTATRRGLLTKPSLWVSCGRNDEPSEVPLWASIRLNQEGEKVFRCKGCERRET